MVYRKQILLTKMIIVKMRMPLSVKLKALDESFEQV